MIYVLIAAAMLLGCLIEGLPYGYFQILRWVVCAVCGNRAYQAHTLDKKKWLWLFIAAAVLFNPIVPIYLDRAAWVIVDVAMAVVLLTSLKFVASPVD